MTAPKILREVLSKDGLSNKDMSTSRIKQDENFLADLKIAYQNIEPSVLRSKAWEHFLKLGLPTRQNENFHYLRLNYLLAKKLIHPQPVTLSPADFSSFIYPECQESVLVFVNGSFYPELSRRTAIADRVVILPLEAATKTYHTFLNNQQIKFLKEEQDPFVALNAALYQQGLFLYLPPKTIVKSPIQLLYLTVNLNESISEPILVHPRLQLFAGAESESTFYVRHVALSGTHFFVNAVSDLVIEEAARLSYTQLACEEPAASWHFEALRASLKRDSKLTTLCVTAGSQAVRYDYRVALMGENAEADLNGLWLLKEQREAHVHVLMDHQAPHCRSMQFYKGIANDQGRASFEGKILVRQLAQKTEAFQLNNNLLLKDSAKVDSKPNLEIFADDVKASHGATIGQLDAEQIFYLKTRGLSLREAQRFLITGFAKEILDKVTLPSLIQEMNRQLADYLAE